MGTIFACGPQCIDGKDEHSWDGPTVKLDNGGTASCSKCGKLAIDISLWMDDGLDEALKTAINARAAGAESQKEQVSVENAPAKTTESESA